MVITDDVFDVGNVPFDRTPEPVVSRGDAAVSRRRSISCDLANVNKRKLRTFDRLLGLPGHRRRDFDVGNVSYRQKMMVRVHDEWQLPLPLIMEHVATVSIAQFPGKSTILHVLFAVYFA